MFYSRWNNHHVSGIHRKTFQTDLSSQLTLNQQKALFARFSMFSGRFAGVQPHHCCLAAVGSLFEELETIPSLVISSAKSNSLKPEDRRPATSTTEAIQPIPQ